MSPRLPIKYLPNSSTGDTVLSSEVGASRRVQCKRFTDGKHFGSREFGLPMSLSADYTIWFGDIRPTSLLVHISHIVLLGTQKQMAEPHARRVITGVTHEVTFWDRPHHIFPRQACGPPDSPVIVQSPIAKNVSRPRPQPTSIFFRYLVPHRQELVNKWFCSLVPMYELPPAARSCTTPTGTQMVRYVCLHSRN